MTLSQLLNNFLSASSEEKKVSDAINKQKYVINKKQQEVKDLLDRIIAEIENTNCTGGYQVQSQMDITKLILVYFNRMPSLPNT